MELYSLLENKRFAACRCGDSRLAVKTNHNFLSKCGQCLQKWRGPLCSNCGFHCCLQCRSSNQNWWKDRVSKLSHWNDNALKQQEEYKQILQSIPQIFLLYNDKHLVHTLCTHIYNTRNEEMLSILSKTMGDDDQVLLNALYPIFESAIRSRDLSELTHLKHLGIITRKYLYEFKKKNRINILEYACTINLLPMDADTDTHNVKRNIEMIRIVLQWIVEYKLLYCNIYDITQIFAFSVHCNENPQNEQEIIKILDMFIDNEIKERGLKKWIDGYSLRRLPLYDYVSWTFASHIPFSVMKWMVNKTIKYEIIPHFISKYQAKADRNRNVNQRSLSYGHLPRYIPNKIGNNDEHNLNIKYQRASTVAFKTYNRILYPLLVMESHYIAHRSLIYEWMKSFIDMDSDIVLLKSCEEHSLPVMDAMSMNSNMVETIMNLCKKELYLHYSLHSFIDIACRSPKLEYRVLQWIQICIEKYDSRLLNKNVKHVSPAQYAENHPNYYCSQIILYLQRKERSKDINQYHAKTDLASYIEQKQQNNECQTAISANINDEDNTTKDESSVIITKLQKEIMRLKQENLKWKDKYFKLNELYQRSLKAQQDKVHSYPTPQPVPVESNRIREADDDHDVHRMHRQNGFVLKNYENWNANDVVNWIIHLNSKYRKYENILKSNMIKENIRGTHLEMLNRNDLSRLGINDFDDKYHIIQQIQALLIKQNAENEFEEIQKEGASEVFHYPSPNGDQTYN
eukprot:669220_1